MYMWIVQARYKCTWILNARVLRLLKSGVVRSIVAPEDCCQKVTSIYVCTVPEIHYYQKKYGMLNASLSLCDTQSQNPMASTCTIVLALKKLQKMFSTKVRPELKTSPTSYMYICTFHGVTYIEREEGAKWKKKKRRREKRKKRKKREKRKKENRR